jgi:hypothetical protein
MKLACCRVAPIPVALLALTLALLLATSHGRSEAVDKDGTKQSQAAPADEQDAQSGREAETDSVDNLTREGVRQLLQELASSATPKNLSRGGCLRVKVPPDTVIYVCSVCRAKTPYTDHALRLFIWDELPECRDIAGSIAGLDVRLDERSLCRKCKSDVSAPDVCLEIRYEDESAEHRACGIAYNQVALVSELVARKSKHRDRNGREIPLKWYVKRLERLFGVTTYPDTSETGKED